MNIKTRLWPRATLKEFVEEHGLTIEVCERGPEFWDTGMEFSASIEHGAIVRGSALVGESGSGRNPTEAIEDLVKKIAGKQLVVDAMSKARRDISVPKLTSVY